MLKTEKLIKVIKRTNTIICILTFVAGERESTLLELIGVCVDAGAILQEYPGHLHVASAGRLHKRCVSVLVVVLNVSTLFQQHLHHIHEATSTCVRQSCVAWKKAARLI